MKIYAHRGMFRQFPENGIGAVTDAFKRGYHVEIDVRFTRDGGIIALHDSSLNSLFGVDKKVSDIDYAEAKKLRFLHDRSEVLQGFEELAMVAGHYDRSGFAVHFKQEEQNPEACRTLSSSFGAYGLYKTSFLFNLGLETCEFFRETDPRMKLGIIVSDKPFEPFVYLWEEVKDRLDLFDIVWAAEYSMLYTTAFFDMVMGAGKRLVVVSHELHRALGHPNAFRGYQEAWPLFIKSGVDGVCTDYPEEYRILTDKINEEA